MLKALYHSLRIDSMFQFNLEVYVELSLNNKQQTKTINKDIYMTLAVNQGRMHKLMTELTRGTYWRYVIELPATISSNDDDHD